MAALRYDQHIQRPSNLMTIPLLNSITELLSLASTVPSTFAPMEGKHTTRYMMVILGEDYPMTNLSD